MGQREGESLTEKTKGKKGRGKRGVGEGAPALRTEAWQWDDGGMEGRLGNRRGMLVAGAQGAKGGRSWRRWCWIETKKYQ